MPGSGYGNGLGRLLLLRLAGGGFTILAGCEASMHGSRSQPSIPPADGFTVAPPLNEVCAWGLGGMLAAVSPQPAAGIHIPIPPSSPTFLKWG